MFRRCQAVSEDGRWHHGYNRSDVASDVEYIARVEQFENPLLNYLSDYLSHLAPLLLLS